MAKKNTEMRVLHCLDGKYYTAKEIAEIYKDKVIVLEVSEDEYYRRLELDNRKNGITRGGM